MKKILYEIAVRALPVVCIVFLIYFNIKSHNTNARISKIEQIIQLKPSIQQDSLMRMLEIKDIQEQSYIGQLGFMSDWLILYVTVLFGVVLVVQFVTFEVRTNSVEEQYKKQKENHEHHIEEIEKKFKKGEADVLRALYRSVVFQCNYCAEKGKYRGALKTETEVFGLIFRVKELDEFTNINEFENAICGALKRALSHINKMYDSITTNEMSRFFFTSAEAELYKDFFNEIFGKVNDSAKELVRTINKKLDEGIEKGKEIKVKIKNNSDEDYETDLG